MNEVISRKDRKATRHFIIGKPATQPAHLQEVDLEALGAELTQRQAKIAAQTVDGAPAAPLAFKAMRDPDSQKVHTLQAELTEAHVEELRTRHGAALIIEEDHDLEMFSIRPGADAFEMSMARAFSTQDDELKVTLKVVDENDAPLPKVQVDLAGDLWSDRQLTNTQGKVTLKLFGETLDSLTQLRLKPPHGHWSRVIESPALSAQENTVQLSKLPVSPEGPQANMWGNDTIGNVTMPEGARVRVAVIDSGFADGHPDVVAAGGRGFAEGGDPEEDWKSDDSGHGTHVAGTIGALNNTIGMRGVADNVDIFALRVFPGASISKLMAAIDTAIELQVDVVNMSLGGANPSALLQQRMQAARQAGILLVAAAGNNAGPVMYPAAYPEVMAVAAIGKHGTFPEDSFHARHVTQQTSTDGSYFAAAFTCRGPEINVCAPGVAIISTVPGDSYVANDGTSMASPHIAGIAAVLLAQNPRIQMMPRSDARSQALFQAVLDAARPLGLPAEFQGSGLPILTGDTPIAPQPGENETPTTPPPNDTGLDAVANLIQKALNAAKAIKERA
ncbi:S8 family peptidase [Phaeobacter sp. HF9A]|uniref:S8 family peptidase n=1 Tax=Phaeobacter sp. HF9A TaxID=2721561 RepID=UPI00143183C0|nr:S8 family peptidase [Phaeobacter sp. HF9A]NIZ13046.1 S8 family peptidase [Phaeobacter sp. HF9A]